MFQNQMNQANPYMVGMSNFSLGINWVNSIQEVERFELPPGGMAVFFDKVTDGMMYIRTRDTYNIYNTKIFSYTEIQPKQPESPYVTRSELEEMFQRFLGGANNVTVQPANRPESTANTANNTASQSAGTSERKTDDKNATGRK